MYFLKISLKQLYCLPKHCPFYSDQTYLRVILTLSIIYMIIGIVLLQKSKHKRQENCHKQGYHVWKCEDSSMGFPLLGETSAL